MPTARGDRSRLASRRLLFTATGILLIAMVNPATLEAWWLRSRFVSPGAALRVWGWDLSVLAVTIVAVFFTGHRIGPRQDQDRPTPPPGAKIFMVVAAALLSVGDLAGTDAGRVTLAILDAMRQAVLSAAPSWF